MVYNLAPKQYILLLTILALYMTVSVMSHQIPETIKARVLALLGTGVTKTDAAKLAGIAISTIDRWLDDANNANQVALVRSSIRQTMLDGVQANLGQLFSVLRAALDRGSIAARDIDALSRAINALEKTSASASGEANNAGAGKVEVRVVFAPHDSPLPEARVIDRQPLPLQASMDEDV